MKKLLFAFLLFTQLLFAQFKIGEAKGLFMAIGVGPRFPINTMANNQNIGVGADITFSYTDNQYIPFFVYTSIGYQHYPGKHTFYKVSDYSSFSSNVLSVTSGVRYYFKPIFEKVIILMPIVEVGANYSLLEKLHQFKLDAKKDNFVEEVSKFGFHVGVGASMFLLDVIGRYNYLPSNQYLSVDMRVNIPIFVKI